MVDGTQLEPERTTALRADWPSADGGRGHAPCRIDRWSSDGWTPVRHYADASLAETALTALRRREPEALLRLVRRTGQEPGADAPLRRVLRARADRTSPSEPARLRRTAGALGLVALATLVCVAGLSDPGEQMSNSRSAGLAAAATAAAPGPASAEPGPLAGYWAHPGAGCGDAGDGIVFQPGRELRIASEAVRAAPVSAYRVEAADRLQVEHADGGSLVLSAEAGGLRLLRARIADIAITPQEPWRLRLCPNRLPPLPGPAAAQGPDTAADAFRLAVRVGDDLAATLALARGLPADAALPGGPSPLFWAMAHDRPVVVAKLLAAGADPDVRGADGRTALSQAVIDGRTALVEALLAGGADPRQGDADGLRPLDHAAARSDESLIDILLAAGR